MEILSHLSIKNYYLAITKAKELINTIKVKAIRPHKWASFYKVVQYGIEEDSRVNLDHIICLVLYCDYTEYSRDFSSTFRKLSITESMEDVKKRNGAFAHQSRLFREIIEGFGICGDKQKLHFEYQDAVELGPFYTGLDRVLAIPEFSIGLASPTSTSKHIEVSLNFATRQGIIIQLNNPKEVNNANILPYFDASWLSRYPDEDERIFAGAPAQIKVESVTIIETKQNFKKVFESLFILDSIVSGGTFGENMKISAKHISLIHELMNIGNASSSSISYDPYITSMVKSYIRRKKKIILNMEGLTDIAPKLLGFVFQGKVEKIWIKEYDPLSLNRSNLISSAVLGCLRNVDIIIIKTRYGGYPFDLFKFLDVIIPISTWSIIKIEQKVWTKNKSWIYLLWSNLSLSSSLIAEYEAKNLKISYHTIETGQDYWKPIEYFKIERL